MTEQMQYYSLQPILSRGADMMFIIGGRGHGKTYSFLDYAVYDYLKNGNQFVYARRYEEEINKVKNSVFNPLLEKYNIEVKTKGHQAFIRTAMPPHLEGKEKNIWIENNQWKVFGYFIPVSEQQSFKSSSFPKVNKLCYDEFIIENSRKQYLPDEVNQWLSLLSTVGRSRKIKAFLLSNSGFISNPFFREYGIDAHEFNHTNFIKRNNGKVIFEYYNNPHDEAILAKTTVMNISGEEYKEYALNNKFKDANDDLVAPKPVGAHPWLKITRDGKKWITIYKKPGHSKWWLDAKNANVLGYSLNRWKPIRDTEYSARIVLSLRDMLNIRSISFASADVRELFLEWLKADQR